MIAAEIDDEDVALIAKILKQEKKGHIRKRTVCLALFVLSFLFLLVALGLIGYALTNDTLQFSNLDSLSFVQVPATICAAMFGSFALWCRAQNCINSIDRSLYAAHAQKYKLFAGFIRDLQCTSEKKRSVLIEIVGSVVA